MKTAVDPLKLRLHEFAAKADRTGLAVPGRFVSGEERSLALHEAHQQGVEASFSGGWPDAERVQCCFHPFDVEPEFTGRWVEARWNSRFAHCEHRSLLGSLMALGIDRSYFGDLIARDDRAWVYCLPEIAVRLPMEWTEAGRVSLQVSMLEAPPEIEAPKGVSLRDTVPSLRLDCILQSGLRTSRSKAADMIREGLVMVDHQPELRTDHLLAPGDLISIHGFGRIRLCEVGEPTRKDRLPITLEVFSGKS